MNDEKYEGSCLCGQVRYEITGPFESFFLCHCQRCRKGTGSAHAANLFSGRATLNWIRGEDQIRMFQVPEARHKRSFCMECGSPVPTVHGQRIQVPAGSLDSEIVIKPNAHIFMEDKAGWDDLEGVEKHDRYQPKAD